MKRILILSVTAASLGLLALAYVATGVPIPFSLQSSAMTAEDVKIPHLDDSNFYQTVKDSKTIVVVDFYADWCGPCRRVAPSIQKLANEYNGKVLVVKVNVDYAPKVSQDQGIRSIPTVAIFAPGESKAGDRLIGVQDYQTYKDWVEKHLNK
ncbi:MAG: thioredoxin [Cyanobacteriota/Melainabacteria group bacterium]